MITYYHPKDLDANFDSIIESFKECSLGKARHLELLQLKILTSYRGLFIPEYVKRQPALINSQPTIR